MAQRQSGHRMSVVLCVVVLCWCRCSVYVAMVRPPALCPGQTTECVTGRNKRFFVWGGGPTTLSHVQSLFFRQKNLADSMF